MPEDGETVDSFGARSKRGLVAAVRIREIQNETKSGKSSPETTG